MRDKMDISDQCVICNSNDTELYITTRDRLYGVHNKLFDVYTCNNCKLIFLKPMIKDAELFELYDEDEYYAYRPFAITTESSPLRLIKNVIVWVVFGSLRKHDPIFKCSKIGKSEKRMGMRFLDIGCGSGAKLFEMQKKWWEVKGVEIGKLAVEEGNKYGLNIFNGTLIEARLEAEKRKSIFLNNTAQKYMSITQSKDPSEFIKDFILG